MNKTVLMNKLTLFAAVTLALGNVTIAQHADNSTKTDRLELVIVRHNAGCDQQDAYIAERIGDKTKKIAFLYPDQQFPNSKENAYNASMIQEILTDYSINGYNILNSYTSNFQEACNKTLVYELGKSTEAWVNIAE
jgi:hypothetical protein